MILLFAALTTVAMAQAPAKGAMGLTGGFGSGLLGPISSGPSQTGSLQFRYYVMDGMALRGGLNFFALKGKGPNGTTIANTYDVQGNAISKTTTTLSGNGWALSVGLQKSLNVSGKLEPYFGLDFWYGGGANQSSDTKFEALKDTLGQKKGDYSQTTITPGSASNWGLKGFAGFNYWFFEKLAIGAEFGYGYAHSSVNGNKTVVTTSAAGTTKMVTTDATQDNTALGGLGTMGSTITLTWMFGK